ncbi:glucokinase [Microbacterium ginsengiterrae]|uniref:Glucokinase n=1 Tax=Microbacterium ginsengiterrae TaxID=546115 RepID=A0A7W9FAN3_9MICO|nr:ROK family transcriptional regulator [Microbacterium ginsengiterrae]MBB5742285.1 glucokinase [Microbacterium ginsengiterrae]
MMPPTEPASSDPSGLIRLLRDGRQWSVSELAATTGVARSTVSQRLDMLSALGLISRAEPGSSTGGRPPKRVALLADARLVLAFDIGASHAHVGVASITREILAHRRIAIDIAAGPDHVLGQVTEVADDLLDGLGRDRSVVLATGVGLPGPVHAATGRPVRPPIMPGWDGYDVPGWLHSRDGIPAFVDNDVNLAALGEHDRFGVGVDNFLYVKVATGIGAGIISGGMLLRGAQGIAGDIGHVRVSRGEGVFCSCGNEGCLEALAAGPAIARSLREAGIEVTSSREVVARVDAGDVNAIQAVRQAGRDLGEVLSASISFLNPSVIAIGGRMAGAGEHLIAGVREVVYRRAMPLATVGLEIRTARSGERAGLMGATALAADHALSPAGLLALAARQHV